MVIRALTLPPSSSRAIAMPLTVVTVNTISLSGYFWLRAFTSGSAEITSPTDRAWIQILPLPSASGGNLNASLSSNLLFLSSRPISAQKAKISVQRKWYISVNISCQSISEKNNAVNYLSPELRAGHKSSIFTKPSQEAL